MIWERVEAALSTLSVPFSAGHFIPDGEDLPDLFLSYFLVTAPPVLHMDDDVALRNYQIQVSVYSRAGLAHLPNITGAMKAAGFMVGTPIQLPFNPETGHYGLALEYTILLGKENEL
ncbi:MAG: hypothetical protein GYA58_03295 [Anaerolineaceae bacterium]|nr:hypothetical protein [Anaerolineaceae bacterium]